MTTPGAKRIFNQPVFRVFEHDRIRVGDVIGGHIFSLKHFSSLLTLGKQTGYRYFTAGHQEIRFKHFVGILATPFLNLEILPKTDRKAKQRSEKWQGVLVDMLRKCQFVRPESPGWSRQGVRSGTLLEWYLNAFFKELESLLRHGLVHQYQKREGNLSVLKGSLQFAKQLKHNSIRKDRFFVSYDHFTDHHPANLILGAALLQLQRLNLPVQLQESLDKYLRFFPQPDGNWQFSERQVHQFESDRKLDRYSQALVFAQHILQNEQADVRFGQYAGLALLFDMNLLFEEYLYRQLLQWKPLDFHLERQQSRRFWGHNRLRPDLLIANASNRWVLDTKWRMLNKNQPSAEELRQMYVYCDYFGADQGVLIFPQSSPKQRSWEQHFYPLPGNKSPHRKCRLHFARVLNDKGLLNVELGKEIFESLGSTP